jgi:thiol-disulfide isomerase/thioredoxin
VTRRSLVMIALGIAALVFAAGAYIYDRSAADRWAQSAASAQDYLVRPHSPVIGPVNAPVTIVKFFDPSCESCRAFYPFLKQIMAEYPKDVRLVIRYAPFREGSDEPSPSSRQRGCRTSSCRSRKRSGDTAELGRPWGAQPEHRLGGGADCRPRHRARPS